MKDPWEEAAAPGTALRAPALDPWEVAAYSESPSAQKIRGIESGGRYNARGPVTHMGDRAYGRYQVMGNNVPSWTEAALGRAYSPDEFLSDPYAQEAVFAHRFGGYEKKYGSVGAARAWFAGEGGMNQPGRRDILGTSVSSYASQFAAGGGGMPPQSGPALEPWEQAAGASAAPALDPWEQAAAPSSPSDAKAVPAEPVGAAPAAPVGEAGTATFGEAFGRGVAGLKTTTGRALEAASELTGLPTEYGAGLIKAGTEEAKQYPARQEFLKIQNLGDAGQFAKETVAELIPNVAAVIPGGVVGGAVGGPIGAAAGVFAGSAVLGTGEVQSQIKELGGEGASAPGWAFGGGTAIGLLDSLGPLRLGSMLVKKFGKEVAEEVAKSTVEKAAARGLVAGTALEVGKSAGIEGVTEALQEAIQELAASGGLDRAPDWSGLPVKMVEAGAAGAVGGAVFGGGVHAAGAALEGRGPPREAPPGLVAEIVKEVEAMSEQEKLAQLGGAPGKWELPEAGVVHFLPDGEVFNIRDIEEQKTSIQGYIEQPDGTFKAGLLSEPAITYADGTDAREDAQRVGDVVWQLARKLGLEVPVDIVFRERLGGGSLGHVMAIDENGDRFRTVTSKAPTRNVIEIGTVLHPNAETLFATVSHEFGHIVAGQYYHRGTSPALKTLIEGAFARYKKQQSILGTTAYGGLMSIRNNVVSQWFKTPTYYGRAAGDIPPARGTVELANMSDKDREYWMGFDEWFAEQVARHFTTSPVVMNKVDRFFANLAAKLRQVYEAFTEKFGLAVTADKWIADWLDARLSNVPYAGTVNAANTMNSTRENVNAMRAIGVSEYPAVPVDMTSLGARAITRNVDAATNPQVRATHAAQDTFGWFSKWMLSIVQVATQNLHIYPLQRYVELFQMKQNERATMMMQALDRIKGWKRLGKDQATRVSQTLDDYMNYKFLTPAEQAAGVTRAATDAEIIALANANGVNDAGKVVLFGVRDDFLSMLGRYEGLLRNEANKLTDPAARARRLNEITLLMRNMRDTAYAPALRFGDLVVLVKDVNGDVVSRYHFETERQRRQGIEVLTPQLLPGERIEQTAVKEQAKPFMGLPPGLLDLMAQHLTLSADQRKELEQIRYLYAPAHGFQHRFQQKSRVAGYSADFMRAYASYFFHGSNYFSNMKYMQPLKDQIALLEASTHVMDDSTKRVQILNFVNEHLNYMLDPRPDFAHLRGAMAHWALGFSPAAAFINLSQVAIGSYPFLAGKFGDARSIAALTKAGADLSSFYKKGKLPTFTTNTELRILAQGVKDGWVTENMAPEMAGLTEQDNLKKTIGSRVGNIIHTLSEYSMFMFQTTEQFNRRVTARAASKLALANPNAAYVQEMKQKHKLAYESLVAQGWTERDAAAYVTARDATESTQYIYHQWANPRFMRGKLRSVFIFKNFLQNTLFMLWHYPEARVRSMLVMAFLGGLMGVPGSEDMKNLIKALGWRLFGKDWDVEDIARGLVKDIAGGRYAADILLHGASRYGFGLPAVMGLMGVPFPTMDMSRSIGLGRILPMDPNALMGQGASKDPKGAAMDSVTQLLGYGFQVNANFYNAIVDTQLAWGDAQRWTKAMPRALAGLSKAWQATSGDDPAIRTRTGSAVIRFDRTDTTEMMEALGMAAGFQPLRLSQKWDQIIAQREAIMFWDLKRQAILRQLWHARESGDEDNYERVLGALQSFNEGLPDEARGKAITGEAVRESFKARIRAQIAQESGVPRSKSDIPIAQHMQELYPEADVSVRRTR